MKTKLAFLSIMIFGIILTSGKEREGKTEIAEVKIDLLAAKKK